MRRPEDRLPDTHCRECGAQLEVRKLNRPRVGGLFGPRQWQADTVCPSCGAAGGVGWATLMSRHSPRNPLMRLLSHLRRGRQHPRARAQMRRRDSFLGDDGRVDLSRLLAAVSFPVYGLNGRPLGLRLRSPGWGGKGSPVTIHRVRLGYVAGDPRQPERAVALTQEPEVDSGEDELGVIVSLVHNYAPKEHLEGYTLRGDIHRDWNLERLRLASRQQTTIQIGTMPVEIRMASWEEPHRVILARLTLGGVQLLAASLNISREELLPALSTLATLKEDHGALAEHQRDLEELGQMLRESHNDPT